LGVVFGLAWRPPWLRTMTTREKGLVLLVLVVWIPGLERLAAFWGSVEYASHGFLVPLVALWAATAQRGVLVREAPAPLRTAPFGLVGSLLVYLLALALGNATLLGLAAVASVVSLVLMLRGVAWARGLRFSLGYLLFAVPLPQNWVTPLIVELQLWVSTLAVRILQAMGVAIHREGNVLLLPGDASLFVAEACSGITSLVTLMPIGVFVAYFTASGRGRRALIALSVLPIAIAANLSRVVLTVLLAIEFDPDSVTRGPVHEWAGLAAYALGCLCLLAVSRLLAIYAPERTEASEDMA
jgi:exosortase